MKKILAILSAFSLFGFSSSSYAMVNLTAETASPTSAPGVSVIAFAEAAAKHKVADMQVTTGANTHKFCAKCGGGQIRHRSSTFCSAFSDV
jgi:hypothetical protein